MISTAQPSAKNHIRYRADIDGLRAIAVTAVILDHLGIPLFKGGFVGVDIFFVISGYLITGNILRDLTAHSFTISQFYRRRFRRIIPALMVMLAAVTVIGYWIFPPKQLVEFSQGLIATACSYSNIQYAFTRVSYFDAPYANILLHTWSLGVEEQFYLAIPIALLLLHRTGRKLKASLIAFAAISFILAVWTTRHNSSFAFFMPWTRAWELLMGSIVALDVFPKRLPKPLKLVLNALSLLVLAAYICLYVQAIPFPGIGAVVPCVAAAVLIHNGSAGQDARSPWRFLSFLGAISYSLYLWHWPVIVVVRLGLVPHINANAVSGMLFICAVSLLLATLSWRFVETPFRAGALAWVAPRTTYAWVALSTVLFVSIGLWLRARDGVPERFSPADVRMANLYATPIQVREGSCFLEGPVDAFQDSQCLQQDSTRRNVLIVGDSHAADLWYALQQTYPDIHFLQLTVASCHFTYAHYGYSTCSRMRRRFFEKLLPSLHIEGVILSERWLKGTDPFDFLGTAAEIRKYNIPLTVIGPAPEYTAPLPQLIAIQNKLRSQTVVSTARDRYGDSVDERLAARLRTEDGVRYISLLSLLCDGASCLQYADAGRTIPLLVDQDHFSVQGSLLVASKLREQRLLTF